MDTGQITAIIGENEAADLLGISVAAASFSTGEYTNSLGQTKVGPNVTLVLLETESNLRVGEGSAVTLGDTVWHVTKITVAPTAQQDTIRQVASYWSLKKQNKLTLRGNPISSSILHQHLGWD